MAGEEGLEPSLMRLELTCYGFEDRYAPYYNIPPSLIVFIEYGLPLIIPQVIYFSIFIALQ